MPLRKVAQHELASFLLVLAHPLRLALVFALHDGERDVSTLAGLTGAPQTAVSQALGKLRSARLVRERREGRHVFYALALSELPRWLDGGFALLITETEQVAFVHDAIASTRRLVGAVGAGAAGAVGPAAPGTPRARAVLKRPTPAKKPTRRSS